MPIKVRKNLKNLNKLIPEIRKNSRNKFKREIKPIILSSIEKGISPVLKGGDDSTSGSAKYEPYSDSYKKQIKNMSGKNERPVNLKVTGKLHRSLKVRLTKNGVFLWFSDKKAKYHDKLGAGPSQVIRRMLPRKNEQFSRTITKKIFNILESVVKKAVKR